MTDVAPLRTAFRRGDSGAVRQQATLQVEESRRAGDAAGEVEGLYALAIAERAGKRELEERPRHVLAAVARLSGNHGRAIALYEASIDLNRAVGNEVNVHTDSHNLALSELQLGHIDCARRLMSESHDRVRQGGLDDFVPYLGIAGVALALADEDPRRGARLIGFTDRAFARLNQVPDPDDASELNTMRDRVAAMLGATTVQTELETGAAWSLTDAFGGTWPRASGWTGEDDDA